MLLESARTAIARHALAALALAGVAGCKSVDDLKSDCENGKIDACESACEKGVAGKKGCLAAAEAKHEGKGTEKDLRRALALATRACDGKEWQGCSLAAHMTLDGQGTDPDKRRAAELFERACDLDSPTNCFDAGLWFRDARPADFDAALRATVKGCKQLGKDTAGPPMRHGCEELNSLDSARDLYDAVHGAHAPADTAPAATGASRSRAPQVRMGAATIAGAMLPEVVQRIVRQNYGRYRLCYEDGLRADANLGGRVSVHFTIAADGTVKSANDAGSDLASAAVVACVVRAVSTLTFPRPDRGTVEVTYPMFLSPGE